VIHPLSLVAGFLPVVLFLIALLALDSFQLVTRRQVLMSIGWGALAATLALLVNRAVLDADLVSPLALRRYLAPVVEEILKASLVLVLIRAHRIGFLVDAGIHGFAAGTGFALIENAWYVHTLGEAHPWLWILRGLGTAVMHGSTTAMVGITARAFADRSLPIAVAALPGLTAAWIVHSTYNHLLLNPLLATALLLVLAPLTLFAAFELSERATRNWLGHGLDRDSELLELIHTGTIVNSPAGEYVGSLRERFPGPVVADMLCILEIRTELAMRAKGLMLARSAGIDLAPDEAVRANITELHFLERSIGPTGRLAMMPLLPEGRERWQIRLLEGKH
jgi:RsiW-degrading membrane proteinase PrsW (M82 family)